MQPNNPFKRKREIPGLFILILVLTVIPAVLSPFFRGKSVQSLRFVGKPAPALSFKDVRGRETSLEDLKGKVVLLNFWASWCEPCIGEMDDLKNLATRFGPQGLELVALNIEETYDNVPPNIKALPSLPDQIFFEPGPAQIDAYSLSAIPQSFVISREGVILQHYRGALDWGSSRITKEFEGFVSRVSN